MRRRLQYLAGTTAWPAFEHNALAQVLNENLWDLGHPSLAPYRQLLLDGRLPTAPRMEGSAETS
ncbi:hypothetical protein ACI780_17910 [Geodermatophilus sp. SYSU D00814]